MQHVEYDFLSDAERSQLMAQHRRERDKRICDRIKAVLLFDKGWSIAAIEEALLLSEDAIREHITEYRDAKKLKPENEGLSRRSPMNSSLPKEKRVAVTALGA